jgi:hypothetical protein
LSDSDKIVEMQQFFKKTPIPHIDSSSSSNPSHEISSAEQDPPSNPALRSPISHYNSNEHDCIRRYYLITSPC